MSESWEIRSAEGHKVKFTPKFEVIDDPDKQDVECKNITITIDGKDYTFNFINLFQFIYFVSSEEFRRGLALRYQRRVNNIPYEVSFKLSKEECDKAFATRRIELPVDELTMAVARNEAWKLMPGVQTKLRTGVNPADLFKGRKK